MALLVVEEIAGVERIVAHVIIQASMKGICARLRNHTDGAAAVAAILGSVVIFQETELGDSLGIRIKDHLVAGHSIVDTAIEQISDRVTAPPRHADTTVAVLAISAVVAAVGQIVVDWHHTGLR